MAILVTGDIHAEWRHLNALINKKRPVHVLCAGDFGYWPDTHEVVQRRIGKWERRLIWHESYLKNKNTRVWFCDGNHENHWALLFLVERHGRCPIEVAPNVFYCPRGTMVEIEGLNVLFFGGALSTDRRHRKEGVDWFPEEVPTELDLQVALENIRHLKHEGKSVDIVVSHQAPKTFDLEIRQTLRTKPPEKFTDHTRETLDKILFEAKPKLWFFGHWHAHLQGVCKQTNTRWTLLNCAPYSGWWRKLPLQRESAPARGAP